MKRLVVSCLLLISMSAIKVEFCMICDHHHINGKCPVADCNCSVYSVEPKGKDPFPGDYICINDSFAI